MRLAMMPAEGSPVGHIMFIWPGPDAVSPLIPAGSREKVRLATSQGVTTTLVGQYDSKLKDRAVILSREICDTGIFALKDSTRLNTGDFC